MWLIPRFVNQLTEVNLYWWSLILEAIAAMTSLLLVCLGSVLRLAFTKSSSNPSG